MPWIREQMDVPADERQILVLATGARTEAWSEVAEGRMLPLPKRCAQSKAFKLKSAL
jgi:hypothetical protein